MFELPLVDPVLKICLLTGAILLAPLAARRLHIPGIVGLILAGILIGPHSFGILDRDPAMEMLGAIGLLYIMFAAGAEMDLHEFGRSRGRTAFFGAVTFLIPMIGGTLIGVYWLGFSWPTSILLASMFASHTLVAYPIVSEFGLAHKEVVVIGLGGTVITDTAALMVLAVIAGMEAGGMNALLWLRLLVALAVVGPGILLGMPPVARWFFRSMGTGGGPQFLFVLFVMFFASNLAHVAGLEPIIGAFLAGLALNRLIPGNSPLMNRLQFFGNYFFIPFFLISVGMLVDLRTLMTEMKAWNVALSMVVVALSAKWLAARLAAWLFGYSRDEGYLLYSLSVAQAAATMAAVLVGYRIGIFDDAVVNGTILMILVTCLVAPWVAERFGRRIALQEAEKAPPTLAGPERILVPVSHLETAEPLVDLAAMLRSASGSTESIHVLTVVHEDDEKAELPQAERLLSDCVARGAAAEVPVHPIIRLDANVADGVLRAVRELGITTLTLGWKGHTSTRDRVFGSVFDQVLHKCRQRIFVSRIDEAINTCKRVVVLLPPMAEYDSQFRTNMSDMAFIARQIGASLEIFCVASDRTRSIQRMTRGQAPTTLHEFQTWKAARTMLDGYLHREDVFVLFSARAGAMTWQPGLDRFPRSIVTRHPEVQMIVLYPSAQRQDAQQEPTLESDGALLASVIPEETGISINLKDMPVDEAVHSMLTRALSLDQPKIESLKRSLMEVAGEYSPEISPGVALLHTHSNLLPSSTVLLATSRAGLTLPSSSNPIQALFVIIALRDQPASVHLRLLAAIARTVRRSGFLESLLEARSADDVREWILQAPVEEEPH